MKDHFIHPSRHPSVPSWSIYPHEAEKTMEKTTEKTMEYRRGECLHIINNFYMPHVDGAGCAK
jgi:hypothetical protein